MTRGLYRRPKFIIAVAATLYAAMLALSWWQGTEKAEKRMQTMLEAAETGYANVINGEIEAALRNVGGAIINLLGGKCVALSPERMVDLAKTFNLDEINIVGRDGITIASNLKDVQGYDFTKHPLTAEFLSLTNSTITLISQPFRAGVANPGMYCKYYGIAFPERDGILQLGMSAARLRQNMYSYSAKEADLILKEWHFSVVGWYERATDDPQFCPEQMFSRWNCERNEQVVGRYFDYQGYQYVAFLPESYCYSQRNANFLITALVLTVLITVFTFVLIMLAKTSGKLEKMHLAAAQRAAADLSIAKTIQMSAIPSSEGAFMEHLEFAFSAVTVPAREVGGDFYDFYPVAGGRLVFLVADVSGKGISGAMFMMEAKNVIKNCCVEFADLAEAITEANARICANNRAELFVTAWIGALDPKTGVFEYVNAGHNRPFIRRADGTIEKVAGRGGRFLGMFEDATYRAHTLQLGAGDILCLYTDGITEAMNAAGEQFGEKRLIQAFTGYDDGIRKSLADFVGAAEQSDDLTGLLLFWQGEPKRTERTFACAEDSLGAAVDFIRTALTGIDAKTVAAVLNAADEVTSNVVNYSGSAEFTISVERACDRLRLTFSDAGAPYNPLQHTDPDVHAAIEDRPIGGLGLVMVKRLADRVTYVRENDRNILTFIKRIG